MALTRLGPNNSTNISGIDLTSQVTGTLPVANGGTAITSGFENGITDFDSWRMTASVNNASSGVLNGTWERQDTNSENIKQGTGMTESSGIFTFPGTGIWEIQFWTNMAVDVDYNYNGFYVLYSTNSGGAFSYLNGAWGSADNSGASVTVGATSLLNVSNASTYRVKADASGAGPADYQGNTNVNYTYFNFRRLGDTS